MTFSFHCLFFPLHIINSSLIINMLINNKIWNENSFSIFEIDI